jgi:hypothetical protein
MDLIKRVLIFIVSAPFFCPAASRV